MRTTWQSVHTSKLVAHLGSNPNSMVCCTMSSCANIISRESSMNRIDSDDKGYENIPLAARCPQFQTRITIVGHVAKFIEINQIFLNKMGIWLPIPSSYSFFSEGHVWVSKHVTQVAHIREHIHSDITPRNMTNERWTRGHRRACRTVEAVLCFAGEHWHSWRAASTPEPPRAPYSQPESIQMVVFGGGLNTQHIFHIFCQNNPVELGQTRQGWPVCIFMHLLNVLGHHPVGVVRLCQKS